MLIISVSVGRESQSSLDECLWLVPLAQGTHMTGSHSHADSRCSHVRLTWGRSASELSHMDTAQPHILPASWPETSVLHQKSHFLPQSGNSQEGERVTERS